MKWILKTIRRILMIPACLSIYTALAGCGSAPAHEVRSIDSQCSAWRGNLRECVITLTGTSNAMTATSPTVERRTNWKPQDGTSTEITPTTASVRTTTISHAANAASGTSDRCTGSNTRDGRPTSPTPTTASARNAPKQRRKRNESEENPYGHERHMAPSRIQP